MLTVEDMSISNNTSKSECFRYLVIQFLNEIRNKPGPSMFMLKILYEMILYLLLFKISYSNQFTSLHRGSNFRNFHASEMVVVSLVLVYLFIKSCLPYCFFGNFQI